mgnify:CR=1 FL=1
MNSKNVKKQSAKALANVSLKLGKMSADSACCYIFHQPKMPEALKKMSSCLDLMLFYNSSDEEYQKSMEMVISRLEDE